jgi:hypothetical protein
VSFLLAEDEALHTLLKGVTVSDERNPSRPVGVWFGMPDPEIREQKYPFLTIDLVGISPENDRALSGPYVKRSLDRPDGVPIPSATQEVVGELPPTPYTLEYQITTWARFPRHDRQILADLLGNALSHKFGDLPVHSDNSIRRLDIVGLIQRAFRLAGLPGREGAQRRAHHRHPLVGPPLGTPLGPPCLTRPPGDPNA